MPHPSTRESLQKLLSGFFAMLIGNAAQTDLSSLSIFDGGSTDKAGELVLYDGTGSAHTLWIDAVGKLRVQNAATKTNDTAGAIVGTQA